jgi:mRNA-degrading endonuclease RelE of RelBE toxin-antitoxin system
MYEIEYIPEAFEDLRSFRKFEQEHILDEVDARLQQEPNVETRNRKQLRPNAVAEWELRIGGVRVFYDVLQATQVVRVEAIGYKRGSRLFIHGQEYDL